MDICDTLNHITHLAFPQIQHNWQDWPLTSPHALFGQVGQPHHLSRYMDAHYQKGLCALIQIMEEKQLSGKAHSLCRQLLAALANSALYASHEKPLPKVKIALHLYDKNATFRQAIICHAPHVGYLVSQMLGCLFDCQNHKTLSHICKHCLPSYHRLPHALASLQFYLHQAFSYQISIDEKHDIPLKAIQKYLQMADILKQALPRFDLSQTNCGQSLSRLRQDLATYDTYRQALTSTTAENRWTNTAHLPPKLSFDFKYPNGMSGDLLRFLLETYGEAHQVSPTLWQGTLPRSHIHLLEIFAPIATHLTNHKNFIDLFANHHLPTILTHRHADLFQTTAVQNICETHLLPYLPAYHATQKEQRAKLYQTLLLFEYQDQTLNLWEIKDKLSQITASLYPDALPKYAPAGLDGDFLDVYIPSLHLAIDFLGKHDYTPIPWLGGQPALELLRHKHLKKKNWCETQGIALIPWAYTRDLTPASLQKAIAYAVQNYTTTADNRASDGEETCETVALL